MPWLDLEARAYWAVFIGVFILVAAWESRRPVRTLVVREERRWSRHAALLTVGLFLTAAVYRVSPAVVAAAVNANPSCLLNRSGLPLTVRWILAILVLDLVRYVVHVAHHTIPVLWRVHQVHHSDPDLDASTGARFHPLEMVLTQGAYLAAIAICAPPVGAVVLVELFFTLQSFLSHANASLPRPLESLLRPLWITPDLHRIHHSDQAVDQNRNFGDLFPWWDRLFRTYLAASASGIANLRPGLDGFQNDRSLGLGFMLTLPFRRAR